MPLPAIFVSDRDDELAELLVRFEIT